MVNQQFYKEGRDLIIGRTPEVSVKISNSGQIVRKFKDLFNQNLDLFLEGKYLKFLSHFNRIKGVDEIFLKEVYQDLQLKFEHLKDTDPDHVNIVILYTIFLNSIISSIRDINFNDALKEIRKRVRKKFQTANRVIQQELDNLFMRNDKNISILYNISYLDTLAESFNFKKVAHVCKIQKSKFINHIVDSIISAII
ncbi:MAG: hypothetical protein KAT66_03290 [Candidatus Lokiarchaeota archaeon]|nr:hypothetical protein [Candidatus Lokiarchaeota archaeon]